MNRLYVVVALALLAPAGRALAQAPATMNGPRDVWRSGHLVVQPEAYLTYTKHANDYVDIRGGGLLLGLTLGGTITDRLMLDVHGVFLMTPDPEISSASFSGQANGATMGMWGVGPVLTVIGPNRQTYLSLATMLTRLTATYGSLSLESDPGAGGQLTAGHQWHAGPFAFGVCGTVFGAVTPGGNGAVGTLGLGLGTVATF